MRMNRPNKKAQVTIFIILAIMIIIVLILLFSKNNVRMTPSETKNPLSQIRDCAKQYTQEAIGKISLQGGSINPENYYEYKGHKIEYLCYTEEYYKTCVVQRALLREHIEKEIEDYVKPKLKKCIETTKKSFEDQGYQINTGNMDLKIDIIPKNILINILGGLTIKKDKTESYKSIKTDLTSNIYTKIMLATSLTKFEEKFGDSEILVYMTYYPSIRIDKEKQGDGTTIYTISDLESSEIFRFASRSLVIAPGLTGK